MRKLLVTGGAGFIGVNFVYYWLANHPQDEVVVLDALTYAGNRASLLPAESNPNFTFIHGDIADQILVEKLLSERALDTIVHFAAESHVDRSITGPDAFLNTNIIGTHNLLKAARNQWLKSEVPVRTHRFHHVSTDEVYGSLGPSDPAFKETNMYAPNSPYAASKAASDHLVRAYHHTYGLSVTTSNCSNNYGPYHFPEKLIPLMVVHSLLGKPLPVYGDGSNIRDWLYAEDHCRGIDLILRSGRVGETYNIGGNNELRNSDIVHRICTLVDAQFDSNERLRERFPDAPAAQGRETSSLVISVEDRLGHDWRYAIDARKINNELGYEPQVNFERGLNNTVQWIVDNESWWRPLLV